MQLPEAHVASGVFAGVSISDSTDEDSEGDYLVAGLSNYLDGAVYFALTEIDERNVMVSDTGCGCKHPIYHFRMITCTSCGNQYMRIA